MGQGRPTTVPAKSPFKTAVHDASCAALLWARNVPVLPSTKPITITAGVASQADSRFEENNSQSSTRIHKPVAGRMNRRCFGLKSQRTRPPDLRDGTCSFVDKTRRPLIVRCGHCNLEAASGFLRAELEEKQPVGSRGRRLFAKVKVDSRKSSRGRIPMAAPLRSRRSFRCLATDSERPLGDKRKPRSRRGFCEELF